MAVCVCKLKLYTERPRVEELAMAIFNGIRYVPSGLPVTVFFSFFFVYSIAFIPSVID